MADTLNELADWAEPLLAKLDPAARRQLAKQIARDLRRSQQNRIKAQENPDGSAYAPRKPQPQLRQQRGRVRRKAMFAKIRTARYLKTRASDRGATVGYFGHAVSRIARVHQYGLRDRVDDNGPRIQYPQRILIGFSAADRARIEVQIISYLSDT